MMQVGVSVTALALAVGMLAAGRDTAAYLPVVTSIAGYWLPAPRRPDTSPSSPGVDGGAGAGVQPTRRSDAFSTNVTLRRPKCSDTDDYDDAHDRDDDDGEVVSALSRAGP